MGFFKKSEKPNTKDKNIYTRIEFELNNNFNLTVNRVVLSDVKFPINDGIITIDLLMICTKGIFLFKPLDWNGEILGKEKGEMWHTVRERMNNPLFINKADKMALANFLRISDSKIIPYVVLGNRCWLKEIPYCTKDYIISKENDLYYFLGLHTNLLPDIFSESKIAEYNTKLNRQNIIKALTE